MNKAGKYIYRDGLYQKVEEGETFPEILEPEFRVLCHPKLWEDEASQMAFLDDGDPGALLLARAEMLHIRDMWFKVVGRSRDAETGMVTLDLEKAEEDEELV